MITAEVLKSMILDESPVSGTLFAIVVDIANQGFSQFSLLPTAPKDDVDRILSTLINDGYVVDNFNDENGVAVYRVTVDGVVPPMEGEVTPENDPNALEEVEIVEEMKS